MAFQQQPPPHSQQHEHLLQSLLRLGEQDWNAEDVALMCHEILPALECGVYVFDPLIWAHNWKALAPANAANAWKNVIRNPPCALQTGQLPLLEPKIGPRTEHSIFAWPLHNQDETSVHQQHWSLLVLYYEESLAILGDKRPQLKFHHFDSIRGYHKQFAQQCATFLARECTLLVQNPSEWQDPVVAFGDHQECWQYQQPGDRSCGFRTCLAVYMLCCARVQCFQLSSECFDFYASTVNRRQYQTLEKRLLDFAIGALQDEAPLHPEGCVWALDSIQATPHTLVAEDFVQLFKLHLQWTYNQPADSPWVIPSGADGNYHVVLCLLHSFHSFWQPKHDTGMAALLAWYPATRKLFIYTTAPLGVPPLGSDASHMQALHRVLSVDDIRCIRVPAHTYTDNQKLVWMPRLATYLARAGNRRLLPTAAQILLLFEEHMVRPLHLTYYLAFLNRPVRPLGSFFPVRRRTFPRQAVPKQLLVLGNKGSGGGGRPPMIVPLSALLAHWSAAEGDDNANVPQNRPIDLAPGLDYLPTVRLSSNTLVMHHSRDLGVQQRIFEQKKDEEEDDEPVVDAAAIVTLQTYDSAMLYLLDKLLCNGAG